MIQRDLLDKTYDAGKLKHKGKKAVNRFDAAGSGSREFDRAASWVASTRNPLMRGTGFGTSGQKRSLLLNLKKKTFER